MFCASFIPAYAASYTIVVSNGSNINDTFPNFIYGDTWKDFCDYIEAFTYNDQYVFYKGHKVTYNGEYVTTSDALQSTTYILVECEHSYSDWTVTTEATCTEYGEKERACVYCGYEQYMSISPMGHTVYSHEYKVPTCESDGYRYAVCAVCWTSYDRETYPATGHSYSDWSITTEATCTEYGEKSRVCSNCETEELIVIQATGHSCSEWIITSAATCTEYGVKVRVCSNGCGYEELMQISPLGHTSTNETITKEATCTENGEKTGVCDTCGENYTSVIQRTGHTYAEATCTEAATCHCCATWGGPLGHDIIEADCESPVRCSRCDFTEGEPLGHDFTALGTCKICHHFDPLFWVGDTNDPSEDDSGFFDGVFDGVNDGISTLNKNLDELLSIILGFCFIFIVIWGVPKIYRKIKSVRKQKKYNNYNYYRRK